MFLLISALGVCALAPTPIATVTSIFPFNLDGRSINTPGVTSFPLVLGDSVATSRGPAVLIFIDGSTVKLGVHSKLKIDGLAAKPQLVLVTGTLDYRLVRGSDLAVTHLNGERDDAKRLTFPPVIPNDGRVTSSTSKVSWANPAVLFAHGNAGAGLLPPLSKHF